MEIILYMENIILKARSKATDAFIKKYKEVDAIFFNF